MPFSKVKIRQAELFSRMVSTRIPFKFGSSVVHEMPIILAEIIMETDGGKTATGVSSCGIPPSWFDKSPLKSVDEGEKDLLDATRAAIALHTDFAHDSVWNLHRNAEKTLRNNSSLNELNDLTLSFGTALMDNALIDAICRASGATFHQALKGNLFGMGPELQNFIPDKPLDQIYYRHTIGLADVIRTLDIETPIDDGLPQSLEQVIDAYSPVYFKIKMSSDFDSTRNRLLAIAHLLKNKVPEYKITMDANEGFHSMEEYANFIQELAGVGELRDFWRNILWVEQPTERSVSLDSNVTDALERTSKLLPVILDESDGNDQVIDRAIELGYQGISAKNCKSALRTLHKYQHIHQTKNQNNFILSSEDLTNVPVVPLNQDLCVAAALGISHSERNGHHYIQGFSFLSDKERVSALADYPALYKKTAGSVGVFIEKGIINVGDINKFGFGVKSLPETNSLQGIESQAILTVK